MTVLEVGWIDYLFGGRRIRNHAGELCVRWAAIPHQSVDFEPGGITGYLGKFERMTVFIAGNYTRDIDVADVAAAADMHPSSAMRLFRQSCGLTVLEYLTMHRIRHAQHLLTEGRMKIRDIAIACGFNSPNRFYAAFKRLVGQQPSDFRDSLRTKP